MNISDMRKNEPLRFWIMAYDKILGEPLPSVIDSDPMGVAADYHKFLCYVRENMPDRIANFLQELHGIWSRRHGLGKSAASYEPGDYAEAALRVVMMEEKNDC